MDIFDECSKINDMLETQKEDEARNALILLLDYHLKNDLPYSELINHFIRETGLFPYLDLGTAGWRDRFVFESFTVDVGAGKKIALHREQSLVLKLLLDGEHLAVSAPTSFGKSLIIDAFIAIRKPTNVIIIVPTIALTDETRRRLQKKFSGEYKIITTAEVALADKNIFVFPQERALGYCEKLETIDLLVIDEFYKASKVHDQERSPSLLKAMIKLEKISKQRYYLAPNIANLSENPFTDGMKFLPLGFNTVFLEKHELYKEIGNDASKKSECLLSILGQKRTKTLIYAGTYSNVDRVSNLLLERVSEIEGELLHRFSDWLAKNYDPNWILTSLAKRGTGIHTGQLHRSLSQIQVRLFDEEAGLHNLISTSSIIEGVNTSAENVIVWSNKNGRPLLSDFTYRNIIGRGGRMFQHFIGNIFILETPPLPTDTQLELEIPDDLLADVDQGRYMQELTKEQLAKILLYKEEMSNALGADALRRIQAENVLMSSDTVLIVDMVKELSQNKKHWRGLTFLNTDNIENWAWILGKVLRIVPAGWDCKYGIFIEFIKILSTNWESTIPELLDKLDKHDISINQFFKLEKNATFKLAATLNDLNVLQKEIHPDHHIDISPFIRRLSNAFLPSCVFELEEYGLPRMISKKIHKARIINFEDEELTLHTAIGRLLELKEFLYAGDIALDEFDYYVLDYFFDGISKPLVQD